MTPTILDGARLAADRAGMIAARAEAVRARRGHPPRLLVVAFADADGRVPHVARKVSAGRAAGIAVEPLVLRPGTGTPAALRQLAARLAQLSVDGVFVQFPFPAGLDGDALAAAIPVDLDVDVMTPARIAQFMRHGGALPPVTVSAGLLLLDAWGVPIAGRRGIVVAEASPFAHMFSLALARRGADMHPLAPPSAPDLAARVTHAGLVIVAAATPGIVASTQLARGAVAIDVGYFNAGGAGDIDAAGGVEHLAAWAPVPGGIGPMTVSALLERTLMFAERGAHAAP